MAKNGQGFFGAILLILRLVLTTIFTFLVFMLLLGFVVFHCMHPAGSHKLAFTLSSYKYADILPKIFYSPGDLETILREQAEEKDAENAQSDSDIAESAISDMVLGEGYERMQSSVSEDEYILLDNLYVSKDAKKKLPEPSDTEASQPSQTSEPENTVLYGCVKGATATYLRLTPSLNAQKVVTIEPGTWCVVLGEETQFYKILFEEKEYYIYYDRLDVFEVPELPEGVAIPGLPKAESENAALNEKAPEEVKKELRGYVTGITPYRTSPTLTGPQAGFLEIGTDFMILDTVNSFYKFLMDGNECYVYTTKVTTYYKEIDASTPGEAPNPSLDASVSDN